VPVPPQLRFWGIDSGVQHAVGGSRYKQVRAAAFMGLRLLQEVRCLPVPCLSPVCRTLHAP
jgi:galactokinase